MSRPLPVRGDTNVRPDAAGPRRSGKIRGARKGNRGTLTPPRPRARNTTPQMTPPNHTNTPESPPPAPRKEPRRRALVGASVYSRDGSTPVETSEHRPVSPSSKGIVRPMVLPDVFISPSSEAPRSSRNRNTAPEGLSYDPQLFINLEQLIQPRGQSMSSTCATRQLRLEQITRHGDFATPQQVAPP